MNHRVLARQGKTCGRWFSNAKLLEHCTVLVKLLEGVVQRIQCLFGEYARPCDVAKVKVSVEASSDILRHKPFDGRHPNLGVKRKPQ